MSARPVQLYWGRGAVVVTVLTLFAAGAVGVAGRTAVPGVQEEGAVKVSVAKANVRAEPNEKAPVLTQVTLGTVIVLKAIEGDWYRVQLAPDPRLGGARVEAYLSKKVATIVKPGASASATASGSASPSAAAPAEPATTVDGMSVALQSQGTSTWLVPQPAHVTVLSDRRFDAIAGLAQTLDAPAAAEGGAPPPGSQPAIWVWTIDEAASSRVLSDRRPVFIAQFKDLPGFDPTAVTAVIVRLAPAKRQSGASQRVVAAARGRADQATRGDADWDVAKELQQDVVRADVQVIEPGGVRIQPSADLPPGEYAVVLRPSGRQKLSGYDVLKSGAASRLFGRVWPFAVARSANMNPSRSTI